MLKVENINVYYGAIHALKGISVEVKQGEIVTLIEQRKPVGVVPAWPWKWLRPFFGHFPDSLWNKLA